MASGLSSPSSVKPCDCSVLAFSPHMTPLVRNGANLLSSDNILYNRFCLQFSKLIMVSVKDNIAFDNASPGS